MGGRVSKRPAPAQAAPRGSTRRSAARPAGTPVPPAAPTRLDDVDLRLLRVFRTVVECGGMAAAELELDVGVSTVSRQIKALEQRLGLTLCRRGRSGFSLTPEGQKVYDESLRLLGSVQTFGASVDALHRRMSGELNLALFDKTATNPAAKIAEAVALFHAQAPDVHLNVHVASINAIERGIIDGSFDVGVIPAHRTSQSLLYAPLFDERMLLYCGVGHPWFGRPDETVGWEDLQRVGFAGLGYHSPNMVLSHEAQLPRAATGYDQEAIATLILSGAWLGFLPDHYGEGFVRARRMRAIAPQRLNYLCHFVGVTRRSPMPSRAAEGFRVCLVKSHA